MPTAYRARQKSNPSDSNNTLSALNAITRDPSVCLSVTRVDQSKAVDVTKCIFTVWQPHPS